MRDIRRKASIADVATRALVSRTTVSHVLSGNRPVSEATERRVRQAIEDLGYVPSHAAQSLRHGSTRTIGVLVPDITIYFFAQLIAGVEDAANEFNFTTVIGSGRFDAERELRHLRMMSQRGVDALVYVASAPPSDQELQELAATMPMALADEEIESVSLVVAVADHRKGGQLLGTHLSSLGHESILLITGPPTLGSCRERGVGVAEAFRGSITVVEEDYLEGGGVRAVKNHPPDGAQPYTAVCALNDLMAIGALAALRDLHFDVPEDISVVGFGDIAAAAVTKPPLTTIRQPAYDVGRTAATQLLTNVLSGEPGKMSRHVLEVSLVVRESTAAPS